MNPIKLATDTKLLPGTGCMTVPLNGKSIFITSGMSTVFQYSIHDNRLIHKYVDSDDQYPYPIKQMECTMDKLVYLRSSGVLYVWSTTQQLPHLLYRLEIPQLECTSFSIGAYSTGGELTTIFCVYNDGSLVAWGIGRNGLLKTTLSRDPQKEYCMPFGKGSLYCTYNELVLETGTQPRKELFKIQDDDIDPAFQKKIFVDDKIVYFQYNKRSMWRYDSGTEEGRYYMTNECLLCFVDGYIFLSNNNNKIHQYTYSGQRMQTLKYHGYTITCLFSRDSKVYSCDEEGNVFIYDLNPYEEDSDTWSVFSIDGSSIVSDVVSVEHCSNSSILTLEPYKGEDDPVIIYMLDSKMKYKNSICFTLTELRSFIESDRNKAFPDNIMAVYSKPRKPDTTGIGAYPTGRIVVKLPVHNIYVTVGSARGLFGKNRVWYAVPLFGGKKRRIGNIKGVFGVSMNHGQIPGDIVYKLYSKTQFKKGDHIEGLETESDYPFVSENDLAKPLAQTMDISGDYVDVLIDDILNI